LKSWSKRTGIWKKFIPDPNGEKDPDPQLRFSGHFERF
jgi:hypothetical protein